VTSVITHAAVAPLYREASLRLDATAPVEELVERSLDWLGY